MTRRFNTVRVIGVPSDLGANIRGANVGPSAVRIAGLHDKISVLGYKIEDAGDILVPIRETLPEGTAKEKYLTTITDVAGFFSFLGIATLLIATL